MTERTTKSKYSERQYANYVAPSGQQRSQEEEKGPKYRDRGQWGGSGGKETWDQS